MLHSPSSPQNAKGSSLVNALFTKLVDSNDGDIKSVLDQQGNLTLRSDTLFWEPLLKALKSSESTSSNRVQQVLDWKMEKLLKESNRNPREWARQICLAGRVNNIQVAVKAFTLMELQQIKPNATVFNSLIYAYGFSNQIARALSLFEVMERTEDCRPTLVTYNTILSIYSHLGDPHNLQVWHEVCKRAGFSPNADTFKYLIVGFMRADRYDLMDLSFKEMITCGVTPSMTTLEAVMGGFGKKGLLDRMKSTFKFMMEEGWTMNENIVRNMFQVYAKLGRVADMEEVLGIVKTMGNSELISDIHNKIVKAYALTGELDDVEFSVGRMLQNGVIFSCPKVVEAIIGCYFRLKAYNRLELFLNRIKEVYRLNYTTYDLLLTEYAKAGQYKKLQEAVEHMKEVGFRPSSVIMRNLQYLERTGKEELKDLTRFNRKSTGSPS